MVVLRDCHLRMRQMLRYFFTIGLRRRHINRSGLYRTALFAVRMCSPDLDLWEPKDVQRTGKSRSEVL